MKIRLIPAILMLMSGFAIAQDKTADRLRQAIVAEEAQQNLDQAVGIYKNILQQFDEERKTAATALFHLAGCYRKQGKKDEAIAAYRRVLQEFSDQAALADASRNYLTKTFGIALDQAGAAAGLQTLEARKRYRELLLQEIGLVERQIQAAEHRVEAGLQSQESIIPLRRELLDLQRTLAVFDAGGLLVPKKAGK